MGKGRNRKPLDMQTGNLTVKQQEQRKEEEKIVTADHAFLYSNRYPKSLVDNEAKREYRRVKGLLKDIDLICDLDINNLVGYCNAYSGYWKATTELSQQPYTLQKESKFGIVVYTNPLVYVQKNYADEMRRFAALCGMTVDSRLKSASLKIGRQDKAINDEFGDI